MITPHHELLLANVDRSMAQAIIENSGLDRYVAYNESRDYWNPYSVNLDALLNDMVTYCARIRLGEVPVDGYTS
jgi:hypothetical protein